MVALPGMWGLRGMSHLHFTTGSFLVAAQSYLLGSVASPTDDMLDHVGAFGLWLGDNYRTPASVYDWADAYARFLKGE